jgi:uncharacterized protein
MVKKIDKVTSMKNATVYAAYLLVIWGCYRLIFKLPDNIEELIIKPIIWLVPLAYLLNKERYGLSSLGITFKNFFPSIYLSLGLGMLFVVEAAVVNYAKYHGFVFAANIGDAPFMAALWLSLATAVSEELAFRGYIFNRIWYDTGNEWLANIASTILWVVIHVPVTIFVLKFDLPAAGVYLLLTGIYGLGASFLFARTKNIIAPILLHLLWSWPIILFR